MEMEIDLGIEVDEKKIEAGGKLPPGWYTAKIEDIYPDAANPCMKVVYRITSSAYAGRDVTDSLWDPQASDTQEKAKTAQDKLLFVAGRIGAREEGTGRISFLKAIGREVVLHLVLKTEQICDSCGGQQPERQEGEKRSYKCECGGKYQRHDIEDSYANVAYDGVYPLDHYKVPEEVRQTLGITVPVSKKDGGLPPNPSLSKPRATQKPAAAGHAPATTATRKPPLAEVAAVAAAALPGMSREQQLAAATEDF